MDDKKPKSKVGKKSSVDKNKKKFSISKKKTNASTKKDKTDIEASATSSSGKKGKKGKKHSTGFKVFRVILIVCIVLGVICVGVGIGVLTGVIDDTEDIPLEEYKSQKLTTFFYDINGAEIASMHDSENRVSVKFADLPKSLVDAVISIEDERFMEHNGIDVKRTLGAVVQFVLNGGKSNFGGSTITQQLVKNVSGDKDTKWDRKIREWYRAYMLETKLNKEEILESYLNTIYLGEGAYGIEVASQTYFNKTVKDLTLAESACLAAIIQTPEGYNPYNGEKSKEKLLNRQKLVLGKMLELGKITQQEHDDALKVELKFEKGKMSTNATNSYFIDAVYEEAIKMLMEKKNVTKGMAEKMLLSDGYKVHTTMDPSIQAILDEQFKKESLFKAYKGYDETPQGAMVIMDHHTGNVVGLVGGAGEKTGDLVLNRAIHSPRQPGSSIKPIVDYGPAFEKGTLYPGASLDDIEFSQGNWSPTNWYNGYKGYVTVRYAVEQSMNIPAIKAMQTVGVDYAKEFARNLGITSITAEDGLAMALGGMQKGVTAMELTAAYAAIANGGIYIKPRLFTKIVDKDGKDVIVVESEYKRAMSEQTAYLLTDVLRSVVTNGTGTKANLGKMPATGKTGQTDADKDRWYGGFSPYYTAMCWYGYDTPKKIGTYVEGVYQPIIIWRDVMRPIHANLEVKQFPVPTGIVRASICSVSGLVATEDCKNDQRGSRIINEIFKSGTVPTKTCDIHKTFKVCEISGKLATEFCPTQKSLVCITRTVTPRIKPGDWAYMPPTETCEIHTKPVEPEKPPVDPSTSGSASGGSSGSASSSASSSSKPSSSASTSANPSTSTSTGSSGSASGGGSASKP